MSILSERYVSKTRLGRPMPGPIDCTQGRPLQVSIARGEGLDRLEWFDDPTELAELENAARVQRERLEGMIAGEREAAERRRRQAEGRSETETAGQGPRPEPLAAPVADPAATRSYIASYPPAAEPDPQTGRPYIAPTTPSAPTTPTALDGALDPHRAARP
ncbi:MAG TPA: hypothetical protein VFF37_06660 [Streptomyces sp.]|nr:hypothetical protein [Streptomyces sp.]